MLLAVCQELGLPMPGGVVPEIAFGFAGGIGGTGSVCGAVVGGVMAIGLKRGRGHTPEEAFARMGVAQEFRRRFEAEMGSIVCRDLTGIDLTTDTGRKQLMGSDIPQRVCLPAVATAYRLVLDLLKETPP